MNKLKQTPINIEMSLIAKGVCIKKVVKNLWERRNFIMNEPAKHGLLFSSKPYAIGEKYLDNL